MFNASCNGMQSKKRKKESFEHMEKLFHKQRLEQMTFHFEFEDEIISVFLISPRADCFQGDSARVGENK